MHTTDYCWSACWYTPLFIYCWSACLYPPLFIVRVLVYTHHCSLLQLRPLFGDQGYLDDQHILIAVKGASDDQESFGKSNFLSFNLMWSDLVCGVSVWFIYNTEYSGTPGQD